MLLRITADLLSIAWRVWVIRLASKEYIRYFYFYISSSTANRLVIWHRLCSKEWKFQQHKSDSRRERPEIFHEATENDHERCSCTLRIRQSALEFFSFLRRRLVIELCKRYPQAIHWHCTIVYCLLLLLLVLGGLRDFLLLGAGFGYTKSISARNCREL